MPTIDVEIGVDCGKCGATLEAEVQEDSRGNPVVVVEPCNRCIAEAYKKGWDDAE